MAEEGALLGHTIIASGKQTLTEQVYDLLCQEIHAGHWEIGERLPSISSMADESGMSSRPIHQALERLQEEGYVRTEKGSGTFLAAVLPEGATPLGSIGIIMARHDKDMQMARTYDELDHWRMHAIIEEAVKHNYTEEIRYLNSDYDGRGMDEVGGLFGSNVKGIISLHNFPREDDTLLRPDQIPFVFLGYTGFTGRPRVTLDLEDGFYRLTKEVIQQGHRSILCVGAEPTAREQDSAVVFAGYERAMERAGLFVDREAYAQSREITRGDWRGYREFIDRYAAVGTGEGGATALVCAKTHRAMDLIAVADISGFAVPDDLSIVSFASVMRTSNPGQGITGIDYNLEATVQECFDLLFKQMATRECNVSVVHVKPLVQAGDSLAPPRKEVVDGIRTVGAAK